MSERKVLTKYYPPDFDPSQIRRTKKDPNATVKLQTVRLMAPFSMKCTRCGEFVYRGRKFNSRKEIPQGLKYLGVQIFRFHIKCTRCSSPIVFRTDPKTNDYAMVSGAIRTMEPWRNVKAAEETDQERLDRLEAEGQSGEDDDDEDPMKSLEQKTYDAQQEMARADELDRLRLKNATRDRASALPGEDGVASAEQALQEEQDRLDAEMARLAFQKRDGLDDNLVELEGVQEVAEEEIPVEQAPKVDEKPAEKVAAPAPSTSWKPTRKKKKDHSALLGIKKKA